MADVRAPTRIWLLDYGSDEATWCTDPSPSGEDHGAVEYVRADANPQADVPWNPKGPADDVAVERIARLQEFFDAVDDMVSVWVGTDRPAAIRPNDSEYFDDPLDAESWQRFVAARAAIQALQETVGHDALVSDGDSGEGRLHNPERAEG